MIPEKKVVFGLLCLGCVTISFNVAALIAAIPLIGQDLDLLDINVARIIPFYMIPYGLGALIYAPLTRYYSYRRLLLTSMAFYSLAALFCAQTTLIDYMLLGRVFMGISGAGAIPIGLMLIGQLYSGHIRGRLVGLFFGCSFWAGVGGVLVGGMFHWRWLFYIPSILGFLFVLSLLLINNKFLDIINKIHINYIICLNNIKIRNISIFIAILSALYHSVHKWFGIYLFRFYSLGKAQISYIFILMAVGGFIGQILGGYISDKKDRIITCYVGLCCLAITTMFLYFPFNRLVVTGLLFGISMSWTIGHNGISTVLTDFSAEQRPVIASLNSSVRFIAGGLGLWMSRLFIEKNFNLTFLVVGGCMLALVFSIQPLLVKSKY
ncbi:MAG: MFS transporter [Candidatus Omnitrophica bacterium]|nr:MFS transporter [Candidatus Omnitrophota bacterium]